MQGGDGRKRRRVGPFRDRLRMLVAAENPARRDGKRNGCGGHAQEAQRSGRARQPGSSLGTLIVMFGHGHAPDQGSSAAATESDRSVGARPPRECKRLNTVGKKNSVAKVATNRP